MRPIGGASPRRGAFRFRFAAIRMAGNSRRPPGSPPEFMGPMSMDFTLSAGCSSLRTGAPAPGVLPFVWERTPKSCCWNSRKPDTPRPFFISAHSNRLIRRSFSAAAAPPERLPEFTQRTQRHRGHRENGIGRHIPGCHIASLGQKIKSLRSPAFVKRNAPDDFLNAAKLDFVARRKLILWVGFRRRKVDVRGEMTFATGAIGGAT